ncbi:DUF2812 domain-containing protein [uncultured Dysosmobacter sp.]|uniref:DUF2812 domain-containing protein n=1 Tax=uncultured Dysosmobacter sp. TaxID=2591384 RepID=UPI0026158F0A|nr:DUF2812 domain-containing protein [uncultured Dysosmobacter sp.]
MKNTKYMRPPYGLYDYQAAERWLSKQAARGWRLEKAGAFLWRFRRAEPARITYAVTYLDVSMFDPRPSESQESLEELCAAAGWAKVTDWLQMQVFCSESADPVPLETDEAVRLDAIHRSMWKTAFPSDLILLGAVLFVLWKPLYRLVCDPPLGLSSNSMLAFLAATALLLLFTVCRFAGYYIWRRLSRRSIAQGGGCASTAPLRVLDRTGGTLLLAVVLALLLSAAFLSDSPEQGIHLLLYVAGLNLLSLIIHHTRERLRDRGSAVLRTVWLTVLVDVALVVPFILGLSWLTRSDGWLARQFDDPNAPAWTAPLSPEDLAPGRAFNGCWNHGGQSVLLSHHIYWFPSQDSGNDLSYTLTISPYPRVVAMALDHCLNTPGEDDDLIQKLYFDRYNYGVHSADPGLRWESISAAGWQAEAAWQLHDEEDPLPVYLLQYPDRISRLHLTEPLTAAQKTLIHDRLHQTDPKTGGLLP